MKTITLDGNNFENMDGFYDEIEELMTRDLDWQIGRNFNALNDIIRGGFGVHEYEESIKVVWVNSEKSKKDFDHLKTANHYKLVLENVDDSHAEYFKKLLFEAENSIGESLFEILAGYFRRHDHVELELL